MLGVSTAAWVAVCISAYAKFAIILLSCFKQNARTPNYYACNLRVCRAQAGLSGAHHALGPVLSADKRGTLALKVVQCLLLTALRLAAVSAQHHLRTRCSSWRSACMSCDAFKHGARRTSLVALLTGSVTGCLLSASRVCGRLPLLKQPCSTQHCG